MGCADGMASQTVFAGGGLRIDQSADVAVVRIAVAGDVVRNPGAHAGVHVGRRRAFSSHQWFGGLARYAHFHGAIVRNRALARVRSLLWLKARGGPSDGNPDASVGRASVRRGTKAALAEFL